MRTRNLSRALVLLMLVATASWPAPLLAQAPAGTDAEPAIVTAPVVLDGVELFRVRGVSSLSAAERAANIRSRLIAVAADRTIPVESIQVVEGDGLSRIQAGQTLIAGVVETDATMEQVSRTELAAAHAYRIRQNIAAYREARTPAALRGAAVRAAIATLVALLVTAGFAWLWRVLSRRLAERLRARIHTVGIQSFEVMRAESIWEALTGALTAIRALILLVIAIIYLGFVLSQFPWTRGVSSSMAAFALAPFEVIGQGLVTHIPSLVFLAVLFVLVRLSLRLIRLFFGAVERGDVVIGGFDREWALPTYKIVRVAVVAFSLVVAYPYIPGSDSAAFQGVSLFLGLVFSLGSSTAIANIIAGYLLIYRRAFKVGDRVKIGDSLGDVIDQRLQVTHLRSVKNEEIIIPNSEIMSGEVVNYSSLARQDDRGVILHTEVGIGYETPWRQVEAMLHEAAKRTEGLGTDPKAFVLEKRLGDFAVVYELNVHCTNVQAMAPLYAALHRHILDVFNEYGVQIMTPAYEGDPPEPKVVPAHKWYAEPATPTTSPPAGGHGSRATQQSANPS
jgi:small-conductance mechanosensitive channel